MTCPACHVSHKPGVRCFVPAKPRKSSEARVKEGFRQLVRELDTYYNLSAATPTYAPDKGHD